MQKTYSKSWLGIHIFQNNCLGTKVFKNLSLFSFYLHLIPLVESKDENRCIIEPMSLIVVSTL